MEGGGPVQVIDDTEKNMLKNIKTNSFRGYFMNRFHKFFSTTKRIVSHQNIYSNQKVFSQKIPSQNISEK